ncbi:MAG: type IV secretory system conjugative DNA transfer family protein [Blastocatellia bacterium]
MALLTCDGKERSGDTQFWLNAEITFLAATMSHIAAAYPQAATPATMMNWLLNPDLDEQVAQLLNSPSPAARYNATQFLKAEEKIRGNVTLGFATSLTWLVEPRARRFTSSTLTPPDFAAIRRQPHRLYWCLPEDDTKPLQPLAALFFTLFTHQLLHSEQGYIPVNLLLDEVANIGRIPDFPRLMTTARSRDIGVICGLQDIAQFISLYSESDQQILLTNLLTKVVLPGLGNKAAKEISETLGDTTVETARPGTSRGPLGLVRKGTSFQTMSTTRRLLTPAEVTGIGSDEMIITRAEKTPMRLKRAFYRDPEIPISPAPLGKTIELTFTHQDNPQLPKKLRRRSNGSRPINDESESLPKPPDFLR